ncbi:MAG: DUF2891 domain-containing protein [Proteobacteria bacterium]|nr:DUF2891 domain-containing protein [Pseudomonadota bacterium]
MRALLIAALLAGGSLAQVRAAPPAPEPDAAAVARFVALAADCARREYPNHLSHTLASDADARPPRELTPAFFGCYDWHSAVHGHWLLARAARLHPLAPFAAGARATLAQDLAADKLAAEAAYLQGEGRRSFERPYGLAWLLALSAELHRWQDPEAQQWARNLEPLERVVAGRVATWLAALHYPVRVGEHSQSAFAFGLMLDAARARGDQALAGLLEAKAREFFAADRACPLAYEPSGEDFLSPCLGEADLMRRVLEPRQYARWLRDFLPQIGVPHGGEPWLAPAVVTDRSDPKLAHLDGLNLSRAWMLEGIAAGLPRADARRAALEAAARAHRDAALPAVTGEHYEGGHWLGTFAVYLTTGAGLGK